MRTGRRVPARLLAGGLVLAPAAFVLGVELVHRCAAGWGFPAGARGRAPLSSAPGAGPHVVLVLGHPSRPDGRLHPVQRWRTEIAVRSARGGDTRWVFSGGGRGAEQDGVPSEAEVMAAHAHDVLGVPAARTEVETRSRDTWQNVALSLPHLQDAATLAIASSPTHAARARRYLTQQRPDLAQRLVPADDYRFGERIGAKTTTLGYGVVRLLVRHSQRALRMRPAPPTPG